jgi:hypothetical protein
MAKTATIRIFSELPRQFIIIVGFSCTGNKQAAQSGKKTKMACAACKGEMVIC